MSNIHGRWVPDPLAPSGFRWQRYDEQPPTHMMPTVAPSPQPREPGRTVRYGDHEDHQLLNVPGGDVGDWIDPNAPDPTPAEVTDPGDPNYVPPWFGR